MKQGVTTKRSMARVPASCPQCGAHEVSFSPLRVWCPLCSFQTAAKEGERTLNIVRRWNRAVRDGIGYYELLVENREREARKNQTKTICI